MSYKKLSPVEQICRIMTRIYDSKLTTASGGNLSIKDEEGNLWVTPSGGDKSSYKGEDILCINVNGEIIGTRKPSIEIGIHKAILKRRQEFNAIVHAHSPAMVAMSLLRQLPKTNLLPQIYNGVVNPRIAKYACPGTDELRDMVEKEFAEGGNTNVAILENHGAFVASKNGLQDAFGLFQDLNFSINLQSKAYTYAGERINTIRPEQIKEYNEAGKKAYEGLHMYYCPSPLDIELDKEFAEDAAAIYYLEEDDIKEMQLREDMCNFMERGYSRQLFTQNIGAMSARLSEDSFLITQRGSDNADLTIDQIVKVKGNQIEIWTARNAPLDGETISVGINEEIGSINNQRKLPSKSVLLHKKIYEENPDVNAVIMAAPINAMVFAVTDYNYDLKTIPECYIVLREDIGKFSFGAVYNQQEELSKYFKQNAPVAIVENDCFICTGKNLYDAFDKLEVLEFSAEAAVTAKLLGGEIQTITEKQVQEIKERFK